MGLEFIQAHNYTRGRIKAVQLIVVHTMEAPLRPNIARDIARDFHITTRQASAHLCVDTREAIQCVQYADTAWHCKNANANGIGIEHAGYAKWQPGDWETDDALAMLERSAEIAAGLCREFSIPVAQAAFAGPDDPRVVSAGFCGHRDVPLHGSHSDPGNSWPWEFYLSRVQDYYEKAE